MLLTEFDEKAYIEGVKKQSYEEGEAKLARLVVELKKRGRVEDIVKVTDKSERERLYREFNIWVLYTSSSLLYNYQDVCIQYAIILTQFKQFTLLTNNWTTS